MVMAVIRAFGSLVFGCVVLCAFIAYLGSSAVQEVFLRPDSYNEALVEEDIYNRVYDELLVDAQFQDKAVSVMGGYEVPARDMARLSREILPPAYLQAQTESAIDGIAAYLSEESSDPQAYINLSIPLSNIRPAVEEYLEDQIDTIILTRVSTRGELSQELMALFLSLERGVIPRHAPSLEDIPPSLRLQAYDDAVAAYTVQSKLNSPTSISALALEAQSASVRALILEGDMRGALKVATAAITAPVIDTAVLTLSQDLDSEGRLDLVAKIAEADGRTRAEFLEESDQARGFLDSFDRGAKATALIVMALATALLMAVHLPHWRYSLLWSGIALLAAGAVGLLVGLMLKTQISDREIVGCGDLPASACDMLSDISANLISSAGGGMLAPAVIVAVVGAAFMLLSEMTRLSKDARSSAGGRR